MTVSGERDMSGIYVLANDNDLDGGGWACCPVSGQSLPYYYVVRRTTGRAGQGLGA